MILLSWVCLPRRPCLVLLTHREGALGGGCSWLPRRSFGSDVTLGSLVRDFSSPARHKPYTGLLSPSPTWCHASVLFGTQLQLRQVRARDCACSLLGRGLWGARLSGGDGTRTSVCGGERGGAGVSRSQSGRRDPARPGHRWTCREEATLVLNLYRWRWIAQVQSGWQMHSRMKKVWIRIKVGVSMVCTLPIHRPQKWLYQDFWTSHNNLLKRP